MIMLFFVLSVLDGKLDAAIKDSAAMMMLLFVISVLLYYTPTNDK